MKLNKLLTPGINYYACIIIFVMFMVACKTRETVTVKGDVNLALPIEISDSKQEYSSMCWYGDQLLLVPQFPDSAGHAIYAFDRAAIDAAITGKQALGNYRRIEILNLQKIKNKIGPTYEGVEATVIIGNSIYFSIETKTDNANCYLVGGIISDKGIRLNTNKLTAIPKLKRLSNAGFESMAYLPKLNKLILFFEYNKADLGSKALLIDTSLVNPPSTINVDPLFYRLNDVTRVGNKLLGLNYHYNASEKEFPEYIGADSLYAEPILQGRKLKEASFSRVVEFTIGKQISWKTKRVIGITSDNWEGIAPYKNGALIITDEYSKSILRWIKL